MGKKPQEVLEILIDLMEHKKHVLEQIDRLQKMQGTAIWQGEKVPKCACVKFETSYGAHAYTWLKVDAETNELLVNTALEHYRGRLVNLELLLGLANEAVLRELGPQLAELSNATTPVPKKK